MSNITISRTTFTDDDGSGTTGTLWNAAQITTIYDQIDAIVAKLQNVICDGRLTLTSGSPVTTADVTGATNIYWSPYKGNRIALYDGSSAWATVTFSETTQALGTLINGQAYDVFGYNSSGTLTLEVVEWKNATVTVTIAAPGVVTWTSHGLSTGQTFIFTTSGALPTGLTANTVYFVTVVDANTFKLSTTAANVAAATFITTSGTQSGTHTGHMPHARQTALALQDGVYVKSGTTTRRYLGSFLTTATTTTEDSAAKRFVFNYYNRVERSLVWQETASSWTYTTATMRQVNLGATGLSQVAVFIGVAEPLVRLEAKTTWANASSIYVQIGIGENSTNTISTKTTGGVTGNGAGSASLYQQPTALFESYPAIGYNYFVQLEGSAAVGATSFYSTAAFVVAGRLTGMQGAVTQ